MSYKIITTPESELTFNQNLDYLATEWDDKVMNQFLDRVDDLIQKIKQNPFYSPYTDVKTMSEKPSLINE